jgi:hypothetical protein
MLHRDPEQLIRDLERAAAAEPPTEAVVGGGCSAIGSLPWQQVEDDDDDGVEELGVLPLPRSARDLEVYDTSTTCWLHMKASNVPSDRVHCRRREHHRERAYHREHRMQKGTSHAKGAPHAKGPPLAEGAHRMLGQAHAYLGVVLQVRLVAPGAGMSLGRAALGMPFDMLGLQVCVG